MAHYLFNVSDGDRSRATGHLRARMWPIGDDERHRDALAPGDDGLIYVASPSSGFIGRAELATPVRPWTSPEAAAQPRARPAGVLLSSVEGWDPPVSMDAVVRRIDPTGSNPLVRANATSGFVAGVVRISDDEYEAVLALRRETRAT